MLPVASRLADVLGLPALGPAEALMSKVAQRVALGSLESTRQVPVPVHGAVEWGALGDEVGSPFVLKPVHGAGSRNTALVADADEARAWAEALWRTTPDEALVAEEYLAGRESGRFGSYVSVESLIVEGRVTHLGVTGKLPQLAPFRETGQFFPSTLAEDECLEVAELAERAVRAVGIRNGCAHTEIRMTEHGPRTIEVNGRLGGYVNVLYTHALGIDVLDLAVRAASGQAVTVPEPPPDRVVFQYTHQPLPVADRLLEIQGAADVRRRPDVLRYDVITPPSLELPGDGRTHDLDLLTGVADNHDLMLAALDELHRSLSFHLQCGDDRRIVTGSELARQE